MNIALLGPPASGKGTCSNYLVKKYNFYHISMGDLLRQFTKTNSPVAQMVKDNIAQGKVVDENLTFKILSQYIVDNKIFDGVLLDGYPRGIISAKLLKNLLEIDKVIVLESDFETIKTRVLNRIVCSRCNKTFSKKDYKENFCDECGAELIRRSDDNLESLNFRMNEYHKLTEPVIEYYQRLGKVYRILSNDEYKIQIDKLMEQNK